LITIPELANGGFTIGAAVLIRDGRERFEIDNVFLHGFSTGRSGSQFYFQ
jgi:hypothetical protein